MSEMAKKLRVQVERPNKKIKVALPVKQVMKIKHLMPPNVKHLINEQELDETLRKIEASNFAPQTVFEQDGIKVWLA